ncbi:hypothetical protein CLV96_3904 [Leptospira meyeri]|uniref:Uncharacterized protein n=1 Tax=Leptospira meyeri TaxID=29508 RepID=A0A4R8MIY3_LEPME|nr:hypothetical protein [Leptospira meyeri]EKJ86166.1 hypothetical protein LEP1GSC017_0028 [Leptospira meyeri serovar Hardjo str. Went 5]TDY66525.1 hypothetical protein CLV96_3904 [Leptospira meyeri]
MKTIHLLGHNFKWNLDSYFQNKIGEGFVFCAYSFGSNFLEREKLSGYKLKEVSGLSMLDLQYFGKKESSELVGGKLKTYKFHPSNEIDGGAATNEYMLTAIKEGIKFQVEMGFRDIIIPNYYENESIDSFIGLVKAINLWLLKNKDTNHRYFMTIPFTNNTIIDETKVDSVLFALTDGSIVFDGYYIVCESKPESKQKVSTDMRYLKNLLGVFSTLKKQKFFTIYAYANWDALVFLSLTDIDLISIATYENLRNFKINRFVQEEDGGPSKGWYFSEKLLNFVKAQFIDLVREKGCLPMIKNEKNIFSDVLLDLNFLWNNHKPEVHKNYLLAINNLLYELQSIPDLKRRKEFFTGKVDDSIKAYENLEKQKVFLLEESSNYHLAIWKSFLLSR